MTVIIRKTDSDSQISKKLSRSLRASKKGLRKSVFDARKFSGKKIFGKTDGLTYQKAARDEWR